MNTSKEKRLARSIRALARLADAEVLAHSGCPGCSVIAEMLAMLAPLPEKQSGGTNG